MPWWWGYTETVLPRPPRLHRISTQTRTSSLGAARPLPPSADIGPGGQSVGQAAQFSLAEMNERLMVFDCPRWSLASGYVGRSVGVLLMERRQA